LWECEGLDETLEKARSDYDLTIVDSPPLLAVSDSHTLARKCDATLLVVRSRRTQFGHIRRAIDILVRAHARQSFFVVNGLDSSDAEAAGYGYGYGYGGYGYGGYGYGYGYGYGHGHRRGDDAETSASHEPEAGQDASHRDRSNSRGQKAG
jgi:Mrp family chromosome partitioning ATPase